MGFLSHSPLVLILILIVVLIIFGPGKLVQMGAATGTAINEFRKATTGIRGDVREAQVTETSAAQASTTTVQPEPENEPAVPFKG